MRARLADGPRTDVAVLELDGSVVADHGDHVVVRTPHNPGYHWGNVVHVTTGDPDDVDRWLSVFHAAFPDAAHVAIGLPRIPSGRRWQEAGCEIDVDDALAVDGLPEQRPLPPGFTARMLASEADWEALLQAELAENERTGDHHPADYERFARAELASRRRLAEAGRCAWFGAFDGERLASSLGIVVLGEDARYASVLTDAGYRTRGLAGHLLGVAAAWAHQRGASRLVIVTAATNPAGRLYRSVGFEPVAGGVHAYRKPDHGRP